MFTALFIERLQRSSPSRLSVTLKKKTISATEILELLSGPSKVTLEDTVSIIIVMFVEFILL